MIHDLTFFSLPQLHSRFKRLFFRSWIRRLARNTKIGVVTPSSATAQEFYHLAPNAPRRTTVALLGYDNSLFSPPSARDITAFTSTLTPPVTQWIAFLGTLEPRKNVPALINAFSSLPSSLTTNTALLLSGGPGWDEAVEPAIMKAQLGGLNVRKLGYLPQEQLKSFLGGAELVVYPSLGEGFGLPVLEAMACGAAVLTTRELSLPEVGGDVAFYTDTDAMSISENLAELLKNPSSLARAKTLGPERAKTFSWASTAEAMAQAISKELSGRSL
ncbi:MAG: glycosyltransferase family 1 protein [Aurantimicrobium sp.]